MPDNEKRVTCPRCGAEFIAIAKTPVCPVCYLLKLPVFQQLIMVVNMRGFVLAEELVTESKAFTWHFPESHQMPDGWWQHFKMDCFPKWLLSRFPVRMETIGKEYTRTGVADFTKYATYPKATITLPDLGEPVYKSKISSRGDDESL